MEFIYYSSTGPQKKNKTAFSHQLVRHLNSQFKEEEVLFFGLKDVHQLEDIGMLHPEEMSHKGRGREREEHKDEERAMSRVFIIHSVGIY